MKEYPLKTRQVALFFIAFTPLIKLFTMPSLISGIANNDGWISITFNLALEFLTIGLILLALRNYDGDFYSFLKENFGDKVAKGILVLYAIYFLIKSILPICEQKDYIELTLYQTSSNPLIFLPFLIISFYLSIKKLRVIGRIADATFLITLIGYFVLIGLSVSNADYASVLPLAVHPVKEILTGAISSFTWFGDGVYLLFFMGNFKFNKGDGKKILLAYLVSAVLVLFFFIVFYGTFTSISFRQRFALTEISKYSTVINSVGRFDYIAIFCILVSNIFSTAMPLYFCAFCLNQAFPIKKRCIYSIISHAVIFVIITFFREYFFTVEKLSENVLSFIYPVFSYLVPILVSARLIFKGNKKELSYEKS